VANNALFGLGAVALVLVVLTTTPAGIALPAGLSPVGPAAAADQNATSNASVAFANQTSNGSNVTIESATLPEGGFIAIHDSGYTTGAESAESSVIATSK